MPEGCRPIGSPVSVIWIGDIRLIVHRRPAPSSLLSLAELITTIYLFELHSQMDLDRVYRYSPQIRTAQSQHL